MVSHDKPLLNSSWRMNVSWRMNIRHRKWNNFSSYYLAFTLTGNINGHTIFFSPTQAMPSSKIINHYYFFRSKWCFLYVWVGTWEYYVDSKHHLRFTVNRGNGRPFFIFFLILFPSSLFVVGSIIYQNHGPAGRMCPFQNFFQK